MTLFVATFSFVGAALTSALFNALVIVKLRRQLARWYITTDLFSQGGKVFDDWGPFSTRELALRVRQLIEEQPGVRAQGVTFAVDRR